MDLKTYLDKQGGNKALASALGLSQVIVSQWKTGVKQVPAEHCPRIEAATHGAVRCEDLRPDVPWSVIRTTDCPIQKLGAGETAPNTQEV